MDKIFAVQNCGISGTNFLQSLFDGHPQILAMPALNGQTLLIFWEHNWPLPKNELLEKFLNDYPFLFQKTDHGNMYGLCDMGHNKNEVACVARDLFVKYILAEWAADEKLTRKKFVVSVYKAYNLALGRKIDENGYLLYPIHCLPKRYAEHLVEDFKEVKFLHMMRESVQNIGSLASHISKNSGWDHYYLLSCCIAQMFLDHCIHVGYRDAYGLIPYVGDNNISTTRALKLEDVHKDARNTLIKICNWLNIGWDDCLLESTFDGKLWHNRPETIRQTGIGIQTISQKHTHLLSKFDRYRLEYLSIPYNKFYGYDTDEGKYSKIAKVFMPLMLCLPFKMESIRGRKHKKLIQYIKCRAKWLIPALREAKRQKFYISLL